MSLLNIIALSGSLLSEALIGELDLWILLGRMMETSTGQSETEKISFLDTSQGHKDKLLIEIPKKSSEFPTELETWRELWPQLSWDAKRGETGRDNMFPKHGRVFFRV